jgi:heptosyltransferase-2
MSFPAITAIKKGYPGRRLIAVARAATAEVYESLGMFSKVMVEERPFLRRLRLARQLKTLFPVGMLILPNSFSTALLSLLSGSPIRIGSANNLRSMLLTNAIKFQPRDEAAHESFKFLRLAREMGVEAPFTRPSIVPGDLPAELELPEGLRLAIAPGAAYGGAKCWPADNFAQSAKLILEGRQGAVIILGAPGEAAAAKAVEEKLSGGPKVLNLVGRTSLREAISVLGRCHLTLANDSGLMHLSGALDVPVVGIFGPTNPIRTSPLARRCTVLRRPAPCSPCRYRECPKPVRICFDDLTPKMVAEAADRLLGPVRNSRRSVIWSPTNSQLWPTKPMPELRFFVSATEIAKANGKPASAPSWVKVIWKPLENTNDWWGLIHDFKLDPSATFWVGDTNRPIDLAKSINGHSVLITTSRARPLIPGLLASGDLPDIAVPDIDRALEWIISF